MTTYFITRHSGALQWAAQQGLSYDVHCEHLDDLEQFHAGDVVIGTLPINIVAALNQKNVRYIHLSLDLPPHLRGIELNAEQLRQCKATLEEFQVTRLPYLSV
ncbi:CRISPR-associated protein Csx16 [Acinetobacter sichuanensis]|uniref:CRISPR-associated protein Csx16 n=1 Tax=Acinetobacter sichuanensis TaxID=2136183 RepID=A0A371YPK8_9GAMM|nr:CRISPR-associated protein Csx16 [Acinetobacter sichuanensis]RFC83409.1 CRISPR-associated protein Csx16 [Acinetobacter sichuanensis]